MSRDSVDWNDVAVFAEVVRHAGFGKAARVLGRPKSSVSRELARLESALGVQLIKRTTRSLSVTPAGLAYFETVDAALARMRDASAEAADPREEPRGVLRVAAPPDVGSEVLPMLVASFVGRHPQVRVEVELETGKVDLVEGGYDLAFESGRRRDGSLVSRRVEDVGFRLFASPSYLARHGRPKRAEELAAHAFVLFRSRDGRNRLRLEGARRVVQLTVRGRIASDDLAFVRRAAMAGAGLALLPELACAREVSLGTLEAVLPELRARGNPLYLVYNATAHVPRGLALFRDHVLREFPRR